MRGTQSPGGRSRARARRAYTVRRLLVALALLLLLALLVPRACQAIIGSGDDGESREDRGQEKAAGAGDTEDAAEKDAAEKADTADDDATDKKSSAGSEGTREDADDQDDGAATDLGGVLTETLAERGAEPPGGSGGDQDVAASGDATTDQPAAQIPVTLDASDQQPAPLQDATGAQLSPVAQRAPADRQGIGSPNMAAPAERSPPGPRAALDRGLVVVDPAPRPVVRPRPAPAPDPVQIDVAPVAAAPVVATPGPPAPVTNDIAFAGGGVATNSSFGGGAAGAPVDNAAAFAGGGVATNSSFGGGVVVATGGLAGARGLP